MNKYLIVCVFALLLSSLVYAQEASEGGAVTEPTYADFKTTDDKINYIRDYFGVNVFDLSNVKVSSSTITIKNSLVNVGGAEFFGGTVVFGQGGRLISAKDVIAQNNFRYRGTTILDGAQFSYRKNVLTIESGRLTLGSATSSKLNIRAASGTFVNVKAGQGYTGTIRSTGGSFKLGSKEEKVSVSGIVEVVNGKIKKAKNVRAVTPVKKLFADLPESESYSCKGCDIDGNKMEGGSYCVTDDCFLSKTGSTAEVNEVPLEDLPPVTRQVYQSIDTVLESLGLDRLGPPVTIKITGNKVKHKNKGKTKRVITTTNGATLEKSSGAWQLSPGTEVVEIKAGAKSTAVKVSQDTTYLPNHNRNTCDNIGGSCVAIDEYNSMRVKAEDNNNIKLNNFQVMPSLTVDKIIDESTVSYTEHNVKGKKNEINVHFSKDPVKVYPPNNLNNMQTRIISQYEDDDGKTKTVIVDSNKNHVQVIDEDSGERKIVGYFDDWVAKNYYKTSLGGVIPRDQVLEYDQQIIKLFEQKLAEDENFELSGEALDILRLLMHRNPNIDSGTIQAVGDVLAKKLLAGTVREYPETILTGVLKLTENVKKSPEDQSQLMIKLEDSLKILNELSAAAENSPQIQSTITTMVEEGKLNWVEIHQFNLFVTTPLVSRNLDNPEVADRVITLFDNIALLEKSSNYGELTDELVSINDLSILYDKYAIKDDKVNAFFDALDNFVTTGEVNENDLILPSSLEGRFNEFLHVNKKVRQTLTNTDIDHRIELWEKNPGFVDDTIKFYDLSSKFGRISDSPEKDFFLAAKSKDKKFYLNYHKKLGELKQDKSFTQELRNEISTEFSSRSHILATVINAYRHQGDKKERQNVLENLNNQQRLEILSMNVIQLGQNDGLYTSTELAVFNDLTKSIGGAGNLVPFMESQGYFLTDRKTELSNDNDKSTKILTMLVAVDQFKDIMPSDYKTRERLYHQLTEEILPSEPMLVTSSMTELVKNDQFGKEFSTFVQDNYQGITVDLKDDPDNEDLAEKRDFMQYVVRRNPELFDPSNQVVKDIVENPSLKVQQAENALKIPSKQWVENADRDSEGKPILRGLVLFTSTKEDRNEKTWYKKFGDKLEAAGDYKKKKQADGSFVLEKPSTVLVDNVKTSVTVRIEVTDNPVQFVSSAEKNPPIFFSTRGHSFDDGINERIIGNPDNPKFSICGSCGCASRFPIFQQANSKTVYVGTAQTGRGATNNVITLHMIDSLGETERYDELWAITQEKSRNKNKIDLDKQGYKSPEISVANLLRKPQEIIYVE